MGNEPEGKSTPKGIAIVIGAVVLMAGLAFPPVLVGLILIAVIIWLIGQGELK